MSEKEQVLEKYATESECRGEVLRDALVALERAGHRLCILHGYEDYPENIRSDVDAISEDPKQIPRILSEQGVAVVQMIYTQATNGFLYVLQRWHGNKPVFVSLHVYPDCRRDGWVFFEGEEFLAACRPFRFFKVPPPDLEFAAYLVKRVFHGTLDDAHGSRLSELYGEDPAGCRRRLEQILPEAETEFVVEAAWGGDWETVRGSFERLRQAMIRGGARRERPQERLGAYLERAGCALRPAGLMVAVLGVDGAGKSTVMSRLEQDLAPAFWLVKRYHGRALESPLRWTKRVRTQREMRRREIKRASVAGLPDKPPRNPHDKSRRGLALSLVKLALWWADYTLLGYTRDIYPRLRRSALVLLDRHYQDLMVDPARHRYGGPLWLARAVGRFLPQPDLFILLDAPPEILHARKQEVSLAETSRQREAYLELVQRLPGGRVVDASRPPDEVVAETESAILDYMAARTARKLKR